MICGYRINFYDEEGDVNEKCIMLHLLDNEGYDNGTILKFKDLNEIGKFVDSINKCITEIKQNHEFLYHFEKK